MRSSGWKPKLDVSRLEIRGTFHCQAHQALEQLTHSSDGISPEMKVCLRPANSSDAEIIGYKASLSPTGARLNSHNDYLALKLWDFTNG